MRRNDNTSVWIYAGIFASTAIVFGIDMNTPLGFAGWVFYFVPIVLSYFLFSQWAPSVVASFITTLVVVAYFGKPSGGLGDSAPEIARLNRWFCGSTIWALAGVGYYFIKTKIAVRRQEWIQHGQTRLSQEMGGDLSATTVGQKVLSFLSEYLDAQAGAVFVADGKQYRRVATCGVPANSSIPEQFSEDDGLLSKVVRDGKISILRDVPSGYFTFGSSLGKASPRNLLIAPLTAEGKVQGVVELGFLHDINGSEETLISRVSESIAVAIQSAQYRNRLQQLVDETQRQSKELQTQSEELRVSNEELHEQSGALKESQVRLEQQQSELEATNEQLHQQTRELELQKDELTRAKVTLEKQAKELTQASSYKSAFLANMSHELRTPLNSSLILAKLLGDNRAGNLTPEQVKYARTIESAGNDLLILINDVLDLAKVEAGHIEVRSQTIRLPAFAESLRATFQPIAGEKKLELAIDIVEGTPETIATDSQRLEQIIRNLLSNAIKFTDKGHVKLVINNFGHGRVAFTVTDTGIGIAEHQQDVIFEPFRQADGSTNRKYGGTGLGLSISREFARLLGGEINVSSVLGEGSTFTLILPQSLDQIATKPVEVIRAVPHKAAEPKASPVIRIEGKSAGALPDDRQSLSGRARVILIVEDDQRFAKIIYDLAHELGFQALVADTAEEAVALAVQYAPSGVVLDLGLPDHSGLSVLDRLKVDARTRHIPVHIVSATDHSEAAFAMGAAGYMLKPVEREKIAEALQKLEKRLTQKLRRVLIVEDNPVQMDSLQRLLGTHNVETLGASSVAQCLQQLRSQTFDCMVLDLSLPDASGFDLLDTLSREDRYSFPPVIVYTGRELSIDEEQKLRKYSRSIIVKGAKSPERLLDEVTLFLHQVVSDLAPEQRQMIEKARSRDAALEDRHILIVEDDVRNIFALTSLLEPHGTKLHVARNGREALQVLECAQKTGSSRIELVLMDLMMPEMDGLTAMREIRKRQEWSKLPIIALTAKAMKGDQQEALAAGATDYLPKPLDVEKLLSLVRVWMPR